MHRAGAARRRPPARRPPRAPRRRRARGAPPATTAACNAMRQCGIDRIIGSCTRAEKPLSIPPPGRVGEWLARRGVRRTPWPVHDVPVPHDRIDGVARCCWGATGTCLQGGDARFRDMSGAPSVAAGATQSAVWPPSQWFCAAAQPESSHLRNRCGAASGGRQWRVELAD
jgi:hypothetical protein